MKSQSSVFAGSSGNFGGWALVCLLILGGLSQIGCKRHLSRDQLMMQLNGMVRSYAYNSRESDDRLQRVAAIRGTREVRLRAVGDVLAMDAQKLAKIAYLVKSLDASPSDRYIQAAYFEFFDKQAKATREWAGACYEGTPKLRREKARAFFEVTLQCYENLIGVLKGLGADVQRDRAQLERLQREWLGNSDSAAGSAPGI